MKIYNSMSRKKEEFVPLNGKDVNIYACGVTVYDLSHIGHARQAIVYAMVADYLKYRGYNVTYVRNYTDVDDKIIKRANEQGKKALALSREQIEETELDMHNLHVRDADITPKASENIDNIIKDLALEIYIEKDNNYEIKIQSEEDGYKLFKQLSNQDVTVTKFEIKKPSLNDIFIEKVGE